MVPVHDGREKESTFDILRHVRAEHGIELHCAVGEGDDGHDATRSRRAREYEATVSRTRKEPAGQDERTHGRELHRLVQRVPRVVGKRATCGAAEGRGDLFRVACGGGRKAANEAAGEWHRGEQRPTRQRQDTEGEAAGFGESGRAPVVKGGCDERRERKQRDGRDAPAERTTEQFGRHDHREREGRGDDARRLSIRVSPVGA
ncbi:MAG: hypothetical protein R3A78_05890 [Polyangiales bacterium]